MQPTGGPAVGKRSCAAPSSPSRLDRAAPRRPAFSWVPRDRGRHSTHADRGRRLPLREHHVLPSTRTGYFFSCRPQPPRSKPTRCRPGSSAWWPFGMEDTDTSKHGPHADVLHKPRRHRPRGSDRHRQRLRWTPGPRSQTSSTPRCRSTPNLHETERGPQHHRSPACQRCKSARLASRVHFQPLACTPREFPARGVDRRRGRPTRGRQGAGTPAGRVGTRPLTPPAAIAADVVSARRSSARRHIPQRGPPSASEPFRQQRRRICPRTTYINHQQPQCVQSSGHPPQPLASGITAEPPSAEKRSRVGWSPVTRAVNAFRAAVVCVCSSYMPLLRIPEIRSEGRDDLSTRERAAFRRGLLPDGGVRALPAAAHPHSVNGPQ